MHSHTNTDYVLQSQQVASSPAPTSPVATDASQLLQARTPAVITPSDMERIVAPIPAFLNAMAQWPTHPGAAHNWCSGLQESEDTFRLWYQLDIAFFGAADTPLDAGVAALLRINRLGYSVPRSYPLSVTAEMHMNPRSRTDTSSTKCLLVFSVSRQATVAACRAHAHLMLQYLVVPGNVRSLNSNERKMMGRTMSSSRT